MYSLHEMLDDSGLPRELYIDNTPNLYINEVYPPIFVYTHDLIFLQYFIDVMGFNRHVRSHTRNSKVRPLHSYTRHI